MTRCWKTRPSVIGMGVPAQLTESFAEWQASASPMMGGNPCFNRGVDQEVDVFSKRTLCRPSCFTTILDLGASIPPRPYTRSFFVAKTSPSLSLLSLILDSDASTSVTAGLTPPASEALGVQSIEQKSEIDTRASTPPRTPLSPSCACVPFSTLFYASAPHPLSLRLNSNVVQPPTLLLKQTGLAPLLSTLLLTAPDPPSLAASLRV